MFQNEKTCLRTSDFLQLISLSNFLEILTFFFSFDTFVFSPLMSSLNCFCSLFSFFSDLCCFQSNRFLLRFTSKTLLQLVQGQTRIVAAKSWPDHIRIYKSQITNHRYTFYKILTCKNTRPKNKKRFTLIPRI